MKNQTGKDSAKWKAIHKREFHASRVKTMALRDANMSSVKGPQVPQTPLLWLRTALLTRSRPAIISIPNTSRIWPYRYMLSTPLWQSFPPRQSLLLCSGRYESSKQVVRFVSSVDHIYLLLSSVCLLSCVMHRNRTLLAFVVHPYRCKHTLSDLNLTLLRFTPISV